MASLLYSLISMTLLLATVKAEKSETITAFETEVHLPEECHTNLLDKKYCNIQPTNYPQAAFDSYLKSQGIMQEENNYEEEIEDCGSGAESERDKNCCTSFTWETPYYITASESNINLVIQAENFQQRIRIASCSHPGESCFKDFTFLEALHYKTACTTHYGSSILLVYNSATNLTETVNFEYPVGCSCAISEQL